MIILTSFYDDHRLSYMSCDDCHQYPICFNKSLQAAYPHVIIEGSGGLSNTNIAEYMSPGASRPFVYFFDHSFIYFFNIAHSR